jgi:WD40 repeat protein
MIRLARMVGVLGSALAIAVAIGCGAAGGAAKAVSPCGTVNAPAWSPDGTQIAWFGYRWPKPPNGHATGSWNILRAFCASDADGKNLHQIPRTVCGERCLNNLGDPPGQLNWVAPNLLVFGSDDGVHTITVGQKPKLLTRAGPVPYSIDAKGDRVATATTAPGCMACAGGSVTIRSVPSGAVVGVLRSPKFLNTEPSLSPDGAQVVFSRSSGKNAEAKSSIWIAAADGSHPRLLERNGASPLWSPAGNRIAYLAVGSRSAAWRLVSPEGGASTLLLPNASSTLFGWSPDGRWLAFPGPNGRVAVIDVATKKVRMLLKLRGFSASSAAWSPNSQQLLVVVSRTRPHSSCPSALWRVPVNGSKPALLHSC